jgi:hypothetical protein
LVTAQRRYYAQTRFGDVFATATRAPLSVVDDVMRIDGVVAVDARAVKTGLMEVPGLLRPATARLIALPDDERRALNRIVPSPAGCPIRTARMKRSPSKRFWMRRMSTWAGGSLWSSTAIA